MAKNTTLFFPKQANNKVTQFVNADGTNAKTIFTAGTHGSRVYALIATSTDTSARIMRFSIYDGVTRNIIGAVTLAIGAGTNGTAASVALLQNSLFQNIVGVDANGVPYIDMESGWTLEANATVAVTAATTVAITALGYDY